MSLALAIRTLDAEIGRTGSELALVAWRVVRPYLVDALQRKRSEDETKEIPT